MKTRLSLSCLFLSLALPLYAQQPGQGGQGGPPPPPPPPPLLQALDADGDGIISAAEIANAPAALKTLDKNGDGKLTRTSTARRIRPAAPAAGRTAAEKRRRAGTRRQGRTGWTGPDKADKVKPDSPWADKVDPAASPQQMGGPGGHHPPPLLCQGAGCKWRWHHLRGRNRQCLGRAAKARQERRRPAHAG